MRSLDELTDITSKAIQLGHDILVNSTPTTIRQKGDRDFVTDVDLTIESEIRDYLSEATPEIGFLGEEAGGTDNFAKSVWTLDPIDGTTNYIHGLPLYAISLALVQQGKPLTAAIDAPALGLRYTATADHGAHCNGQPIQVSATDNLSHAVVAIGDYAVGPGAAEKNTRRLQVTAALLKKVERIRMLGTASLDLAWVAHGHLDAMIMLSNKPWDVAAGILVAQEAGARLKQADGEPYKFQSSELVACTNGISQDLSNLTIGALAPSGQ